MSMFYLLLGLTGLPYPYISSVEPRYWAVIWDSKSCKRVATFTQTNEDFSICGWLVVYLPLWKYEFVSWDDDIPNIWKNKKCSKPPTKWTYMAIFSPSFWFSMVLLADSGGSFAVFHTRSQIDWISWDFSEMFLRNPFESDFATCLPPNKGCVKRSSPIVPLKMISPW